MIDIWGPGYYLITDRGQWGWWAAFRWGPDGVMVSEYYSTEEEALDEIGRRLREERDGHGSESIQGG